MTEYLPPYAPELNPVEYIWAYWKQHELPNVCPKDYGELSRRARRALRRMQRKPRLITALLETVFSLLRLTGCYAGLNRGHSGADHQRVPARLGPEYAQLRTFY